MDEFTAHCVELLSPLGAVRTRRMFGAYGLYVDDLFLAIIADEQLYLKTDAETKPQFEAAGCEPFRFQEKDGRLIEMSYFQPPEEAVESSALMQPWARLAFAAALRAQAKKLKPPKAPTKKRTTTTPAKKRASRKA